VNGAGGAGRVVERASRLNAQRVIKRAARVRDLLAPPRPGTVVLCYHRVGGRSAATEIDLPTEVFARQVEVIARAGVQTLDDALVALGSPEPPAEDLAVVTFDDGTADFVDVALPILVEHNVPAVLYLATEFIEKGREFPDGGIPLSWGAIEDALSTGLVTVGSHTHTHALLDRVSPATAEAELNASIELLFERVGVLAEHFAYPKALPASTAVERVVRERFSSAAVAGTHKNEYGATDPYRLARSPVQRADGMRWFEHKLAGGLRLEDDFRRLANRVRYLGATT
jgi:peptidoglycan/xylan/chitin deacetylase (PgdA/CDA1 family)